MHLQLSLVLSEKQSHSRGGIRWGRGRGEDEGGKIRGEGGGWVAD